MRHSFSLILVALMGLAAACGPTTTPPTTAVPPTVAVRISVPTTKPPMPTPTPMLACATTDSLRIRSEPDKKSKVLGGLPYGMCVKVFASNAERTWIAIGEDSPSGWVDRRFVSIHGDIQQLPVMEESLTKPEVIILPTGTELFVPSMPPIYLTGVASATPSGNVLSCADTRSQVGKNVTCRILHAYCSYEPGAIGSPTYCYDAPYPSNSFTLVAWRTDWSDYEGKCILVTGLVTAQSGKPQIEGVHRSQVRECQ